MSARAPAVPSGPRPAELLPLPEVGGAGRRGTVCLSLGSQACGAMAHRCLCQPSSDSCSWDKSSYLHWNWFCLRTSEHSPPPSLPHSQHLQFLNCITLSPVFEASPGSSFYSPQHTFFSCNPLRPQLKCHLLRHAVLFFFHPPLFPS